jgi:outer membrane protein
MFFIYFGILSSSFAKELTIEEALKLTIEQNPQLKQADYDVERAKKSYVSAKGMFDPQVTASVGRNVSTNQQLMAGVAFDLETIGPSYRFGFQSMLPTGTSVSMNWNTSRTSTKFKLEDSPLEQEFNPFDTRLQLNLSQPLLQGSSMMYNLRFVKEAQRGIDVAVLRKQEQLLNTLTDVSKNYWNVQYQKLLLNLAIDSIEVAEEEVRAIQAQVTEGNLASVELDRVEVSRLSAEVSKIDAENVYLSSYESFLVLLGLEQTDPIQLVSVSKNIETMEWNVEKEFQKALEGNLSLQILKQNINSADQRAKEAHHALFPDVSLVSTYTLSGWEEEFSQAIEEVFNRDLPGSYVGLEMSIPIANWSDQGDYQQKLIDVERAKQDLRIAQDGIKQQVQSQVRILQVSQRKIALAEQNIVVAEKTLEADKTLRDLGRNVEKDVLASIQSLKDARTQLAKAKVDQQQALLELARLKGDFFYVK